MVCGYDYHEHRTLGDTQFNRHNTGTRIAGLIDRESNKIAVATEFGDKSRVPMKSATSITGFAGHYAAGRHGVLSNIAEGRGGVLSFHR